MLIPTSLIIRRPNVPKAPAPKRSKITTQSTSNATETAATTSGVTNVAETTMQPQQQPKSSSELEETYNTFLQTMKDLGAI
jgi:hypothetical protein